MNRAPGIRKHVFLRKVCFRSQPPRVLNELMPCQQLTKCIRMIARRINLPCPEIFTSHSPRVGGNSSAAAAGIPIEIRQHFGMWSQRSSAQSYDAMIDDRATATSSPFSGWCWPSAQLFGQVWGVAKVMSCLWDRWDVTRAFSHSFKLQFKFDTT